MLVSVTAFAAESDLEFGVSIDDEEYLYDGVVAREPAPAVSSVKIEAAQVDKDTKHLIVAVFIVGFDNNQVAKCDGKKVSLKKFEYISRADKKVYAYREYYDCGKAVVGEHKFTYKTTSINHPHNTVSASATITVTKQ